jgi:hypothetical protein
MQRTLGTALAGLVLGGVGVPLAMAAFAPLGFLVFAALAAVAAVQRGSRAFGGGVVIAFGLWWIYFIRQAVERCAALNRQPGGSCAIYGTGEQVVLAACVAFVGALVVAIAVRQRTATRA